MTQMMDQIYKTKWVNALRSGKYKQGKNFLNNVDENTYCCLGVLCDILQQEGKLDGEIVQETLHNSGQTFNVTRYSGLSGDPFDRDTSLLPETACSIVGLIYDDDGEQGYDEDPHVTYIDPDGNQFNRALSTVNDNGWHDFNAIADLIEAQF